MVIQNPRNGGGGGSIGGPVFNKIMTYLLSRYGVVPTGTKPANLPIEWSSPGGSAPPFPVARPRSR